MKSERKELESPSVKRSNTLKKHVINWTIFLCGLSVMSFGISIVTVAGLGTTPISALPLVSSYISGLTFGQTTLIINVAMILVQLLLLRRKVRWIIVLQLPLTFFFAHLIDLSMSMFSQFSLENYWEKLTFSMFGNAVLALGVSLEIYSQAAVLPGEGMVVAMSIFSKKPFPKVKIFNDCLLVVMAIILSVIYFKELQGIREGTIISAITVGLFVKFWRFFLNKIPYEPKSEVKN